MFDRLAQIEARWKELNDALSAPEIVNDSANYQKTAKAQGELVPIVEKYQEYKKLQAGITDSRAMLEAETDPEMRAYAEEELQTLEQQLVTVDAELKVLLLPKDPNDEKNVVLEIRAGTGGDEATLFAAEVFRMYMRYAEIAPLEGRSPLQLGILRGRPQGSHRHHRRPARLLPAQV